MNYSDELERVRRRTSQEQLQRIDHRIEQSIRFHASQPQETISKRIAELEQEWSIERWLETNASTLALSGAALGLMFNRKWLLFSLLVSGFLLQHAVTGWCPPVPALRRMGVRTRSEIDREKFALKSLRGDFKNIDLSSRARNESASQEAFFSVNS
jgi:hypothetical protein